MQDYFLCLFDIIASSLMKNLLVIFSLESRIEILYCFIIRLFFFIFGTSDVSAMFHANIFSLHIMLLMFLSNLFSHLFNCNLPTVAVTLFLIVISKKIVKYNITWSFLLCQFFFLSFITEHFGFRSMILFQLIFAYRFFYQDDIRSYQMIFMNLQTCCLVFNSVFWCFILTFTHIIMHTCIPRKTLINQGK